jgi:hypothetical protein
MCVHVTVALEQYLAEAVQLLKIVWSNLAHLDDLSASLSCLLRLLSALYTIPSVAAVAESQPLASNVRALCLLPSVAHFQQSRSLFSIRSSRSMG